MPRPPGREFPEHVDVSLSIRDYERLERIREATSGSRSGAARLAMRRGFAVVEQMLGLDPPPGTDDNDHSNGSGV